MKTTKKKKLKPRIPFEKNLAGREEAGFVDEKNDCTVRGLAIGLGIPYNLSHDILKNYGGRKDRKGIRFKVFMEDYKTMLEKKFNVSIEPESRFKTIRQVIADDPVGIYIIRVRKHLTCVKHGVVIDSHVRNWLIKQAWKITERP